MYIYSILTMKDLGKIRLLSKNICNVEENCATCKELLFILKCIWGRNLHICASRRNTCKLSRVYKFWYTGINSLSRTEILYIGIFIYILYKNS